jgi:thiosulfate/3-mercaptopyruvate sulfurtransferase
VEGGLPKYKQEGHSLTKGVEKVPVEKFTARFRPELVKSYEQVVDNQFKDKKFQLLDARPPGRFCGTDPEPRKGSVR